MSIESIGLIPEIKEALKKKGYDEFTPIQKQAIPHILEGSDLIGIAQTGTGKTAAFLIPILQRLSQNPRKARPARMRALILTPTRELATQINENMKAYGKGLALSSTVIFGGVGAKSQIQDMQKGQQVLVATPGRLLDLMGEGHILFDQLEYFVLDEADRMLDLGFIRDIKRIIQKIPKEKQTVLFSATMSHDIEKIAEKILTNPVKVEVTPQSTTVEKIEQSVVFLDKRKKPLLLKEIIKEKKVQSALVFSRTKYGCDRIVKFLDRYKISAAAIHGNKSQNARERALKSFKEGQVKILVATDIAARGIDISQVSYVFNYDIPNDPSSYVHRIGRTARAGREGTAIAFCDETEDKLLKAVEKVIKSRIPEDKKLTHLARTLVLEKQAPQNHKGNSKGSSFHRKKRKKKE